MSFFENNRFYIGKYLNSKNKSLPSEERKKYYNTIKDDCRRRIRESYSESNNIIDFYVEVFEHLFFFDAKYLLINLFLEENVEEIIFVLNDKNLFEIDEHVSDSVFNNLLKVNKEYSIVDFIEDSFKHIVGIPNLDFVKENSISFMNQYPKWLIDSISHKNIEEEVLDSLILFTKMWSSIPYLEKPFNQCEAIKFFHHIDEFYKKKINKGSKVYLYKIINCLELVLNDCFVSNIIYSPITDLGNRKDYKPGYLTRRKEFISIIEQSKFFNEKLSLYSFSDLFERFLENSKLINDSVSSEISSRLNRGEIPNQSELKEIEEIEENLIVKENKDNLYEKMYLFERLSFNN